MEHRNIIMKPFIIVAVSIALLAALINAQEGPPVGTIGEVKTVSKEIIVKSPQAFQLIKMGDRLYVRVDGKAVVMRATFPMQTIAKCSLEGKYAGYWGKLVKGIPVYRYVPGVETDSADADTVKAATTKVVGGIEFVFIPGGSFMMGQPNPDIAGKGWAKLEQPVHKVTLSPFWMGKYEVTQEQYRKIMGKNPSYFKKGGNYPVETVSWYDAVEFCNELSMKSGLTPCYTIDKTKKDPGNTNKYDTVKWTVQTINGARGFRLPTEAEWEYACRAGTNTKYYWGNAIDGKYCWYDDTGTKRTEDPGAREVGQKIPNKWGLHDMSGNVWEWCADWLGSYSGKAEHDPKGAESGEYRVRRGGSWLNHQAYLRSTNRFDYPFSPKGYHLGIRLVMTE